MNAKENPDGLLSHDLRMDEKDLLEAIGQMMDIRLGKALQPINERLGHMEEVSTRTALILENEVAPKIALLQEGHMDVVRSLKRLEKLPEKAEWSLPTAGRSKK